MTTIKLFDGDLGNEVMMVRCNLSEASSPVQGETGVYEFWTDGGDQDDIEADSLEEAAEKASRKIKISEWNDGAWGIVKNPNTDEQMDVPSRATE